MLRLLIEVPGPGYPADYLLARIQGRSSARAAGAGPAGMTALGLDDRRYWEEAVTERLWLFRQLDAALRAVLAPLFVYFELNTMARVLRYLDGDRPDDADQVLQSSLLAPKIRSVLRGREGVAAVLSRLERSPAGLELALAGISKRYSEGGLQRCEELLRSRFLARALAGGRQRDLVFFVRAVIDIRNMLTVAKSLRWGVDPTPALLPGGQAAPLGSSGKAAAEVLARMVRRWTHGPTPADDQMRPEHLEPLLQAHLLRRLAGRRRAGSVAAAGIEYAWRGHALAREQSLRLHTAGEGWR